MQIDRIGDFYRSIGVRFADRSRQGASKYLVDGSSGFIFEINQVNNSDDVDRTTRLAFALPDFHAAMESLASSAAVFVEQPRATAAGLRAVVRDPDGRLVDLFARRTRLSAFVRFVRRLVSRSC